MPGCRLGIVARTYDDARNVCVEGESGLLATFSPAERRGLEWNRSMGEGILGNGSRWTVFSSEKPDGLRGPQFHVLWADELAAWEKHRAAWEQVPFVVRLPWTQAPERAGRIVVSTTPRPVKEIRELLKSADTAVTGGASFENWKNLNRLAQAKLETLQGTRLGRQELLAEILDDVPGALWARANIEKHRVERVPEMSRIIVGIDPAVTSGEDADETGIIVVGKGVDGRFYVLADRSCRLSPDSWARRAVEAYEEFEADRVVAEVNQGGDLVERLLRNVSKNIPYKSVRATKGKRTRAEPIAALYEQGKVSHVGLHERLEDQQCTFTPDGYEGSPDRVDALVWALTELSEGTRVVIR
jgi:predicted phage terminase large subunit-like protein